MIKHLFIVTVVLILSACGPVSDEPQIPDSTSRPPGVNIGIEYPVEGSIIYAEVINISGFAEDAPQQFTIEMIDTEDQVIAQTSVDAQQTNWSVELVHGYTGEPSEMILQVEGSDAVSILISDVSNRPYETFGTIIEPLNGVQVGGDMLLITGRASGIPENTFTLQLVGDDETIITSTPVTIVNPYFIDEVPWQAEIATEGYIGQAQIRMVLPADNTLLNSIIVTVTNAAG